ncbi:MAG: hypothetical protein V4475_11845 [Pseudomonadota bacterium]
MTDTIARIMKTIEGSTDAKKLRQIAINAREKGEQAVARAADLRLYAILPSEAPGTLEYDVWQSIHALEGTLSNERSKTTRLARTRQKIKNVGELATVRDLVLSSKASDGFFMLIERDMPALTFEHVALQHPDRFDSTVLDAASARLKSAGIEHPQS